MLTQDQITQTGRSIAKVQLSSGLIPWYEGGHIDPWNHIEAAIALSIANESERAQKAFDALVGLQNSDGSFCHYYLAKGVKEPNRDPNVISYIALGLLALSSYIDGFEIERYFDSVQRAIDYTLSVQRNDGGFPMIVTPEGRSHKKSLLAASCSILVSLNAANCLASQIDIEIPEWKQAEADLEEYLTQSRENLADKSDWAMDWYYPSFTSVTQNTSSVNFGSQHVLIGNYDSFIDSELGVRCISSRPWHTAAETSEAAIAFSLQGLDDIARALLVTTGRFRGEDGSYSTGIIDPVGVSFPFGEVSTYSAAAVLIADSVIKTRHIGSFPGHFMQILTERGRTPC